MTQTTRRRTLRTQTFTGDNISERNPSDGGIIHSRWTYTVLDRQITVSEGHAWPKDRGVRDAGGNFDTVKLTYRNAQGLSVFQTGPRQDAISKNYFIGNLVPNLSSLTGYPNDNAFVKETATNDEIFGWVPSSSDSELNALGTSFIASTIPTNPVVSGSVALAELYREGLPSLLGHAFLKNNAGFFRSLGSEYLNYQFGWLPFVSDLKNAAEAIMHSHDILQQLKRDSGRDVHRKRTIPRKTVSNTVASLGVPNSSNIEGQAFLSPTTYRVSDILRREQWFSGCYTFHFDPGHMSEIERIATQARLLYGLELTPEVVWNLAPWSWLVDWVSNVGPLLHNVSAFQNDGLVLRYGYVMEKNHRHVVRNNLRGTPRPGGNIPAVVTDSYSGLRKTRRKATPYGFGLDLGGFTNRQWSILAALGITRGPRRL